MTEYLSLESLVSPDTGSSNMDEAAAQNLFQDAYKCNEFYESKKVGGLYQPSMESKDLQFEEFTTGFEQISDAKRNYYGKPGVKYFLPPVNYEYTALGEELQEHMKANQSDKTLESVQHDIINGVLEQMSEHDRDRLCNHLEKGGNSTAIDDYYNRIKEATYNYMGKPLEN